MAAILLLASGAIVVIVGVFVISAFFEKRRREAFAQHFPPISDAEFMARCRPGTDPQVALRVRRIVAEACDVDYERIYPSSRFEGLDPG